MSETAKSRLVEFSEEMVAVVEQASSGVVRLHSRRRLPSSAIVWSQDGLIVTADHVLEFEEGLTVGLGDGTEIAAKIVGRDPSTDVAVLRVNASDLAPAARTQTPARVGTLVLALGRPYSEGVTASVGIVSQRTGPWRTWRGGLLDGLLMSDVAMYPGFSGGALVDAAGSLIGVNTSVLVRGVATAVPVQTLERAVEMLSTHGRVRRGFLGVSSHPVPLPDDLRQRHGLRQPSGLLVVGVEPGSPADRAGLMLGDVLVAFAGQAVQDGDDLQGQLGPERVGTEVTLRLLRGGEPRDLGVTVGERP
jgi:S1-C subfamily serine protease